jgi:hypothetical protein
MSAIIVIIGGFILTIGVLHKKQKIDTQIKGDCDAVR